MKIFHKFRIYLLFGFLFLMAGCMPILTLNYSPSSMLAAQGQVNVGDFTYSAANDGHIKPNQIKNTAIGGIYFDKDISVIIKEAVFKEFRFVGLKTGGNKVLTGDVQEFLIDDLGFDVDLTLKISYQLIDDKTNVIYSDTKIINKNTPKFINQFQWFNESIKLNIEALLSDQKFIKQIN